MGYFSNGTEGALYYEQYCARCVHDKNEDCPVLAAHLLYSYQDANKPESILHMLIPQTENGCGNAACLMFIERAADRDLFEEPR